MLFSRALLARRLLLRFHRLDDHEVGQVPREGRLATTLGAPSVVVAGGRLVIAAVVGAAIPRDDDGQLGGPGFQGIEATHRTAAHHDFNRLLLLAGGGGAAAALRCFERHASAVISA